MGSEPAIWRRLSLPGDTPLDVLHETIQVAFGWENSHLHQFEVKGTHYADPGYGLDASKQDERAVTLAHIAPRKGDRLHYTYDFGDDWVHEIIVEAIEPSEGEPRVTCLDGERAGPPEDSGASGATRTCSLRSPTRHTPPATITWIGWVSPFDPAAVDRDAINATLAMIKVPGKRRR